MVEVVKDLLWARVQVMRRANLLSIRTEVLYEWCGFLSISKKGEREEIVERIHKEIWRDKYGKEGD
jgi:uncharacterized protein YunC (DUF1805 family)